MPVDDRKRSGRLDDDSPLVQYHDDGCGISGCSNIKGYEFMILDAFQADLYCKTFNYLIDDRRKV